MKGEQAINEAESKYKVTYCMDTFQPLLVQISCSALDGYCYLTQTTSKTKTKTTTTTKMQSGGWP